ncbi:response to benomyl [Teratosphaeria destructans]|uniref:Response to benomyl n=1 Tax=Teratosphaeria destructans TaxID=418781 RepID=A0A9W7SIS4_9PEZI|nr:response to benomyl [Teratosphaeria destructans]
MSATTLQALLRFLSQDAKVPLAMAMAKVKDLQAKDLDSPEKLAKVKATDISSIFDDEKVAKQIITSAKRVSKKRAAGVDGAAPVPKKPRKQDPFATAATATDLESSLELPKSDVDEDVLAETVVVTNRAPLVLTFVVTLLKYTMPEQPLSSRLSLAQGYVSTTSRSRAVSLGIQEISKEEQEAEKALGEGQPNVKIMGHELKVLRRWGYEWKRSDEEDAQTTRKSALNEDTAEESDSALPKALSTPPDDNPALWALDLEALRKSNRSNTIAAKAPADNNSNLPIYTPQSARAYLLKSFDNPASPDPKAKKPSAASRVTQKEENLGKLLRALDMVYESWAPVLEPEELDQRTWGWYVKVRPSVENGVAGWGGKNEVKLGDVLALRRPP